MIDSRKTASDLLAINAVFLRPEEPFTWASGIKSPIYCDNRLILTSPERRIAIEQAIADTIIENYPEFEILMGTSTAGIAHAAIAAHILGCPMGYVRSGSKDHGRQNKIEGAVVKGQKAVVIEDLISTGGSVVDVVDTLRGAGLEVLGIVSIFSYNMLKGVEKLSEAKVKNISLTNIDILMDVAVEEGYIKESDRIKIKGFLNDPSDEGWMKQ